MRTVARIAVEKMPFRGDRLFDYRVPEGMRVGPGTRVMVPFGRGSQRVGLVVELAEKPACGRELKSVASLLDSGPALNGEELFLLRWLRDNTFCTYFDALSVLLPAGYGLRRLTVYSLRRGAGSGDGLGTAEREVLRVLRSKRKPVSRAVLAKELGVDGRDLPLDRLAEDGFVRAEDVLERRVGDRLLRMVRLTGAEPGRLTEKQESVYRLLERAGCASVKELCYFAGVCRGVVEKLVASGAAEFYETEILRTPYGDADSEEPETVVLNAEQRAAEERLWKACLDGGKTGLLYGVTGSGKTLVYLSLVKRALEAGLQAIILVPEIALTPQTVARFKRNFGRRAAVIHSALSLAERLDEYKRVRRGDADIVVGTRSAVFAPLPRLGLIIVDEEQEHTYRSGQSPRYDAREVARVRTRYHRGLTVFCSATPSVESMYHAEKGDYLRVELTARYGQAALPDVTILDLRSDALATEALSEELCLEIRANLERGEQTILLQNRRGYSSAAVCACCHEVLQCPNCSVALKYHAANRRLMCHYCGYSAEVPGFCPHCGKKMMRYTGVGTQKIEEALKLRFPDARVLRMDADTTMRRESHRRLLEAFGRGEYDILVGTQMVAKGLDFPRVTLVGVLSPDQMLCSDDFRGQERAFSLITQVVGRSGRETLPGRAVLQTYQPDSLILQAAARQDYMAFYETEIVARRYLLYPPFCRLYCLGFRGSPEHAVREAGEKTLEAMTRLFREEYPDLPVRILGLSPARILKVAGKYRYKILMKARGGPRTRELLRRAVTLPETAVPGVTTTVDPNYDSDL